MFRKKYLVKWYYKMKKDTRYIFTQPLFYDGVAWIYLKYDTISDKIDMHIVKDNRTKFYNYQEFINIVDSNARITLDDDTLIITYECERSIARLTKEIRKSCCKSEIIIKGEYHYLPGKFIKFHEVVLKTPIPKTNNNIWNQMADFLNNYVPY